MGFILLFILFLAVAMPSPADTLHVPEDYATIQEAIDVASSGDTVLVAPGTYVENLDIDNYKYDVIIQSSHGPEMTVIDGKSKVAPTVHFSSLSGGNTLEGFSIINGKGMLVGGMWHYYNGGGIYCHGSQTIRNNIIRNNTAGYLHWVGFGGGIYCTGSSASTPHLIDNVIEDNHADASGGGLYLEQVSPTLEENTIRDNSADQDGGGIYCDDCSGGVIARNTIENNQAQGAFFGGGGGLYVFGDKGASPEILQNTFNNNTAFFGGGIFLLDAPDIRVSSNVLWENIGFWQGGGLHAEGSERIEIVNNIFAQNNGTEFGGGISLDRCHETHVLNNTLAGNLADAGSYAKGGGLALDASDDLLVKNSIFWDNLSLEGAQIWEDGLSLVTVTHCNVQEGYQGTANIDQDPLFFDPDGGDYHLSWPSPCINRATDSGAPSYDLDGEARPFMGTTDMGADEFIGLHSLEVAEFTISGSLGGAIDFSLNAGFDKAGRAYLLLGSISRSNPGTLLPGGHTYLPVNWDPVTDLILTFLNSVYFQDFYGNLDASGTATARFDSQGPLDPGAIGLQITYGFALGWPWEFASNPVNIIVLP